MKKPHTEGRCVCGVLQWHIDSPQQEGSEASSFPVTSGAGSAMKAKPFMPNFLSCLRETMNSSPSGGRQSGFFRRQRVR